ncbi:Abasic site processing protein [Sphingomonas antarctica]|uniref:SOS response-associated peptidase n=1 Tax=Sphingomonas antarctica TaxID=2040274 RepID=UPI0039E8364A
MCGRYRNRQTWSELHGAMERFLGPTTQPAMNLQPMEQVRPTNSVPVIRMQDGVPTVANARWGLIPWMHKGPVKAWKYTTFNAKAETVRESRTFRSCFTSRRCLVAGDGWYEWSGPRANDPKKKQPYLFTPKADQLPMAFAGLWDRCETADEGTIESFTIVTQPAGSPLNGYHDRAPVTLFGEEWARWLDCSGDVDELLGPESRDRFDVVQAAI